MHQKKEMNCGNLITKLGGVTFMDRLEGTVHMVPKEGKSLLKRYGTHYRHKIIIQMKQISALLCTERYFVWIAIVQLCKYCNLHKDMQWVDFDGINTLPSLPPSFMKLKFMRVCHE